MPSICTMNEPKNGSSSVPAATLVVAVGCLVLAALEIAGDPSVSVPQLSVPKGIDLGSAEQGSALQIQIDLSNVGKKNLELRRFQTSCGCTPLEMIVGATRSVAHDVDLAPGEQVRLAMDFVVRGQMGTTLSNIVRFETNDIARPMVQIPVTVRVRGGLKCIPPQVTFANILIGSKAAKSVVLEDTREPKRSIDRVESSDPRSFVATLASADSMRSERCDRETVSQQIQIELNTEKQTHINGVVRCFHGADTKPLVEIPVSASILPHVTVSPPVLTLPRQSGTGPLFQGTCLVRHWSGLPIRLEQTRLCKELDVNIVQKEFAATVRIEISAKPESIPDSCIESLLNMTAVLETGERYDTEVRVRCHRER